MNDICEFYLGCEDKAEYECIETQKKLCRNCKILMNVNGAGIEIDDYHFRKIKKRENSRTSRCHSCGKETGMFMISQWLFGLIKRIHCVECVNKKLERKRR